MLTPFSCIYLSSVKTKEWRGIFILMILFHAAESDAAIMFPLSLQYMYVVLSVALAKYLMKTWLGFMETFKTESFGAHQ